MTRHLAICFDDRAVPPQFLRRGPPPEIDIAGLFAVDVRTQHPGDYI